MAVASKQTVVWRLMNLGASLSSPAPGRFRSWPLLVLAFGVLIALMVGSNVVTMQRAGRLHTAISEVNEAYSRNARALEEVRSGIHVTSLLMRDYVLDPRPERAEGYRTQIRDTRVEVDRLVKDLFESMPQREAPKLQEMRQELRAYWDTLEPIFTWTPQESRRTASRSYDIV
jgi:hypothetical protein